TAKKNLFEVADGGTTFLDEIGDTTTAMQIKLLRVLQERRIRRVGGTDELEVNVRVLAATNQDLEQLVRQKRFREDLYYRINVIQIRMPALREKPEDIPKLALHFLVKYGRIMGKKITRISEEAMRRAQGIQTRAAEILGMSFRSFRYFAKKYRLAERKEPRANVG